MAMKAQFARSILVRNWIAAGFSPTNPSMIRRGYNATSLGAVSVNAPYISIVMA
jgi:hypothetical protein